MYHPSRGGVRGGSDQFTWDTVKSDKHRENYLGHSVMAPVGRWQKGKDLSWYSKKRKAESDDDGKPTKSMQKAIIKKAEEDAMLAALGYKPAKKEQQSLDKEEIAEVLKRNPGEPNSLNIGGVSIESPHASMLGGGNKQSGGVLFETCQVNINSKHAEATDVQDSSRSFKSSESEFAKRSKKDKHKKKQKHRNRSPNGKDELTYLGKKRKKEKKKHHHRRHH